jgi:hypothetical protein
MRYKLFLILFVSSCLGAGPVFAQDRHYRVEILVLTHLRHESEPLKVDELRDFSDSLDFLAVPDPEEEAAEPLEEEMPPDFPAAEEIALLDPEAGLAPEEKPDPWADVLHIETRSDIMQEAWRRLRLSAPFRPLQYLSWVQSASEPFPLLRIHDEAVVLVDDPYAEQRAERALAAEESESAEPPEDEPAESPEAGETTDAEPELPDPTLFYALDGTVRLVRTRFLHLELDLEMREPVFEAPRPFEPPPSPAVAIDDAPADPPRPDAFEVHKIQQRRQVRTDRMEYFDGPVIGVLAYITTFDMESAIEALDTAGE